MLRILPLLHLLCVFRKPLPYFILFCQQLPVHLCSFFPLKGLRVNARVRVWHA